MRFNLQAMLIVGVGLLAAGILYWGLSGHPPLPDVAVPATETSSTGLLVRADVTAADHAALLERPLFTAGRRIFHQADTAPDVQISKLVLRGVLLDGDGGLAMFEVEGGQQFHTLRRGDKIGGWRLTEAKSDRVILERSGKQRTFVLPFSSSGEANER